MNLLKRLKNRFQSKEPNFVKIEDTNIVSYDTNQIFIPKIKDLSVKDQEIVKKYISEINLEQFESLMNYSKELNRKFNQNITLLIDYLYELEEEVNKIKLIKEENKLLEKRIKLTILWSKVNLLNNKILKIQKETFLRIIALQEVIQKQKSIVYEFLGIFGESKRIKIKALKRDLNNTLNQMKISLITIEMQQKTIDNSINNLFGLMKFLDIYSIISKVNNNELKIRILKEKIIRLEKIFKILFEKDLIDKEKIDELVNHFSNDKEQELINRLAVLEYEIDVFAYKNKEKLPLFLEELRNLEIVKENQEELLKKIEKLEIIFDLYQHEIKDEDRKLLYEKKFSIITLDIDKSYWDNPFERIKNPKEKEVYEEIVCQEFKDFFSNKPLLIDCLDEKWLFIIKSKLKYAFDQDKPLNNIAYLALLLTVNHPELYKEYFQNSIFNNFFYEVNFFEYDPKIFTSGEEKRSILFSSHLSAKIYLQNLAKLMKNRCLVNVHSLLMEEGMPLLFLLLYGKYSTKSFFSVTDEKLTISEGIIGANLSPHNHFVVSYLLLELRDKIKKIHFPTTYQSLYFFPYFFPIKQVEEINIPPSEIIVDRQLLNNRESFKILDDNHPGFPPLTKIILDEGIEVIDAFAFSDCKNLREIYLPSSLKYISKAAFLDCFIEKIYYHPTLLETFGENFFYELVKSNTNIQFIPLEEEKLKVKK